MPSCDVCRTQVTRRINLRTKLNRSDPQLDEWLKNNLKACQGCMKQLPTLPSVRTRKPQQGQLDLKALLPDVPQSTDRWLQQQLPNVPKTRPADLGDCRPCARAVSRLRKGPGELGSNLSQACTELSSCQTCLSKVTDGPVAKDMAKVVALLKLWTTNCSR